METDEIVSLLSIIEKANPNLYPKLKAIHNEAMERLEELGVEAEERLKEKLAEKAKLAEEERQEKLAAAKEKLEAEAKSIDDRAVKPTDSVYRRP